MALVPAKCTQCGGQIEVDDSKEAGICKHCGTAFITEKVINNYTTVNNITNNITKIINGKESDDSEEQFNRGLVNLKLKKYDLAKKNFDKAIKVNPEEGKYYLYWCVASSRNFYYYGYFFDNDNNEYYDEELREYSHDFKLFFELTKVQERKQLSEEFGLDLSSLDNARYSIFEQCLAKNNDLDAINYIKAINMLSKDKINFLKDKINNWVNRQIKKLKTEQNKSSRLETKLFEIIKYNIEEDIYPLSRMLFDYEKETKVSITNSSIFYHFATSYVIEDSTEAMAELKRRYEQNTKQANEKEVKEKVKDIKNKFSWYYLTAFGIAFVVFVIVYFKKYYDLYQAGNATLGAPIKVSFLIALVVFVVGIGIVGIFHIVSIKKLKNKN